DHWPRHMFYGFTVADHWRKSFLITNQKEQQSWSLKVPRAAEIDGCSLIVNCDYCAVSKLRLSFDGKPGEPLTLARSKDLQTFTFAPQTVQENVGVELLEWDHPPKKSNSVGLNLFRLHIRRPPELEARIQPVVDPGVIVRYPQGKGGI